MNLKSQKKFFLQPKSSILIFIVLAVLMITSAIIELNHSKKELLDLMKKQAHVLLKSVIVSSQNALLTYEQLERFLEEKLINSAWFIKYLYDKNQITNKFLHKFAEQNDIYRINIFNAQGKKIYSSHEEVEHQFQKARTDPIHTLKPIFEGEQDTLIIGYKVANYEEGTRFAVAMAAKNRSAIVLNLDAEKILQFRKQIGFGTLIKNIANNPGIIYIALQDSMGIIAASGNVRELDRIEDSPFLVSALVDSTFKTRITGFDSLKVFEAVYPFYYGEIPVGLFRLGLSLEPLNQIKARIYRRMVIITIVLMVIGVIMLTLIFVRQNYNLLQRQYQVVETYSSNIIRNVSDGVIVIDGLNRIKIFNRAAEILFQRKVENVLGEPIEKLFEGADCEKLLLSPGLMSQIECTINNQKKSLLISRGEFTDENGEKNFILVIRDLTEQRKLEAQLQRKERLSAMGALASGVAHEIRNPLNAVGTIVQQLDKDFEPVENSEEYHQLVKVVVKEVHRINETINDFLKFARPEPVRPERFVLSEFINYLHQKYKPMLDEHQIKFSVQLNWDGEVYWDRGQMQQVFMNLIQNAIDAIKTEGRITLAVNQLNDDNLEILVRDDGPGISENIRSKIFNLYFTTKAKGTGIGLSVVQRIVYEHGGVISVESSEGDGTVFVIQMPIAVDESK